MTQKRFSQLTEETSINDADSVAILDNSSGSTKRITKANFNLPETNRLDAVEAQVEVGFSSGTTSTVWWEELGRTTLGSAGDTISIASFSARKYLKLIISCLPSGAITATVRFNNDSGSNYASVSTTNGGAASSSTSATSFSADVDNSAVSKFAEFEIVNISNQPKLVIGNMVTENASGAGTYPNMRDIRAKWQNTSAQITRVDVVNTAAGDFASGSEVIVLGHD